MKKLLILTLLFVFGIVGDASADDRLKPNTSINELTSLAPSSAVSGDYLLGYDASGNDWVKIDATSLKETTNYEASIAANALATSECGKTVLLSTTGHAETLPTPTAGCEFDFIVGTVAQAFTVVTSGDEIIKGLGFESETDTTEDGPTTSGADTITFVSGSAAIGDRARVTSDGTYWYAITFTAKDGGVTFSSAI